MGRLLVNDLEMFLNTLQLEHQHQTLNLVIVNTVQLGEWTQMVQKCTYNPPLYISSLQRLSHTFRAFVKVLVSLLGGHWVIRLVVRLILLPVYTKQTETIMNEKLNRTKPLTTWWQADKAKKWQTSSYQLAFLPKRKDVLSKIFRFFLEYFSFGS